MDVTPFDIRIPDDILDDLQRRLDQVRWPDELPHTDWDYGTNLAYLQLLVNYWQNGFDWRRQEALLNTFSHFRANVSGMGIHFIHERGQGPSPMPIIITHGWPSTFFEMYKIIPMLTDPARFGGDAADAFDVVVPSMPGYGFSDKTTERGVDPAHIGDVLAELMAGLSYSRFAAQGGDWGASITARLAYAHPDHVLGIHTMLPAIITPDTGPGSRALSEAERKFLDARNAWRQAEGGYSHIQGTKPQTL
ncbi:epoxide hydrolase family protein [Candidatus Entotheonella palauensis]|uniref:epoxide hydrolase family protein n=1 Tax=Candidatus Entotheonella palauensis TaxID=93172 RepID=UPI00277B5D34|nr:epoxide hydrolase [Candidatus Entotheonella palauensis]